jgi:hypothetical protein
VPGLEFGPEAEGAPADGASRNPSRNAGAQAHHLKTRPHGKPWAEWREDKQNLERSLAPEGLQDSA